MRPRSSLLSIPLLLASTGCVIAGRTPKCPSQGRAWMELTTKHFVVLTDVDEQEARAAATDYETELEELRAVAFPRPDHGAPITIVLFRNDEERFAFRSGTSGGDYSDRLRGDVERSPTIVLTHIRYATQYWIARQIFLHELTHRLVHETYGAVPVWMDEGLADYLSTMTVDDGKAMLGQAPFGYRLARGYTASVDELLSVPRSTFYGDNRATVAGEAARNRYYHGAWAFVHYLQNGPAPLPSLFRACLRKLDAGESLRDAWRETLGTIPKAEFEQGFTAYVTTTEQWTGLELPIHPAPPSPVERARMLPDEEVHLLWGRLSNAQLPATDPRSEEAQIAEAARVAPGSPEVLFRLGCLALQKKQLGEALARFEQALAISSEEPRYALGAIDALLAMDPPARPRGKLEGLIARLEATARTADELSLVAELEAEGGQDAPALAHAQAAIAADPGYYGAFAARAFVHFRAGRYAEAVADQERAVGTAAERSGELEGRLKEYKRVAEEKAAR